MQRITSLNVRLLVILLTLPSFWIDAQNFERVESVVGLGDVEENAAVAVADYDGDFDLDIFIVAKAKEEESESNTFSRLFRNNNDGTFSDVTEESGLVGLYTSEETAEDFFGLDGFKHGASWGDYNNDGWPDLLLTYSYRIQLFRNLGNGTFIDLTQGSGLNGENQCRNTGATWFDYDNDGFLDLYINVWDECDGNILYRNNGNGSFTDISAGSGATGNEDLASYVAFPYDFNSDGLQDIYVTNDFDEPNDLFINQGNSTFNQAASAYGVDSTADDMGVAFGDFNNDGAFDLFITAIDKNILLVNNGDNTFSDQAASYGVDNTGWAWGARFADFDLDGDEDLIVVNGYDFENRDVEQNVFFRNLTSQGQPTFEDASAEMGFDDLTVSVEAVDFDYDNDGDLDIYVTNSDQTSILYENKLLNFDQPSALNWFKVDLRGTVSNRNAFGTEINLTTASGTYRRYYSGVGFLSQSIQPVHFGLGGDENILELQINWPSGLVETYNNLDANIIIRAIEGQGIEVLDIGPSIKVYGCTDPESCSYDPEATVDDGSCTYLPAQDISGATSSGFLKEEIYTYPLDPGSVANWSVEGGELISGQGTGSILVRWGLEETGRLMVRENNDTCFGLEIDLEVSLNINAVDDNKSVVRIWNEALLEAIRGDFARPTVHARNLFHVSVAMYDAWAIYDDQARPYLIGNTVNGFSSELEEFIPIEDVDESRKKAISYAAYRLISHRFQNSPGAETTQRRIDMIMEQLGYDTEFATSTLYQFGNAAYLGNYVAETIINYGNSDGSREQDDYSNAYYEPVNPPLNPTNPGNPALVDPNRWQPLSLDSFIDQSGNVIGGVTPDFLSPEWGNVWSFAMSDSDQTQYTRNGDTYNVYNDPGDPPFLSENADEAASDAYKWGFSLVSVWGAHLDPNDGVVWDISPASIGNIDFNDLPDSYEDYPAFYDYLEGGDISPGHAINPVTSQPYEQQLVPRGDYGRVLAEFWADGPDSETPPGHWFTILNYVNDHPQLEKRFAGQGDILDPMEWEVKSYFILGGAMHDSAISAWSVKGWYDYIRPVSAIRFMAEMGQSTDETLSNYHPQGIPLVEGLIEVVEEGDPLAGFFNQNVGKIKLYSWRGPDYIDDPETDFAGVGWILADNWWPYQRPTFVTPPFAGFVSGHSTYSRAAAEVLTLITGTPYFPGGVGEFVAKKDEFLVFEQGPSVDVVLQWATYRDASDQCSLSRIWGGIHPPADDIPGRKIGQKVGIDAFEFAVPYFSTDMDIEDNQETIIFPNPIVSGEVNITNTREGDEFLLFDISGRLIRFQDVLFNPINGVTRLTVPSSVETGVYLLRHNNDSNMVIVKK